MVEQSRIWSLCAHSFYSMLSLPEIDTQTPIRVELLGALLHANRKVIRYVEISDLFSSFPVGGYKKHRPSVFPQ